MLNTLNYLSILKHASFYNDAYFLWEGNVLALNMGLFICLVCFFSNQSSSDSSSYYENTCQFLEQLFPDGKCPPEVTQCRCPFKANKLEIRGLELTLPELPPEIAPAIPVSYANLNLLNI